MELLPPIPKTNRKFPIARPYGNPTGPISLVGRQDGAPAISVGLRRSAGDVPYLISSTLGRMHMGQVPQYRNVPPDFMAMPIMHAEGRRMMTNLAALRPMPSVSDQVRELKQAYSAEAVSGKYVNDIKMAVRYDYGQNPYAGYATARRDAQFNSPAFMGSSYFYPDQFQHRGISLAGGLGGVGFSYDPSKSNQFKVQGGARGLYGSNGGFTDYNEFIKGTKYGTIPDGALVTIQMNPAKYVINTPGNQYGFSDVTIVAVTYNGQLGYALYGGTQNGEKRIYFVQQDKSASGSGGGSSGGAAGIEAGASGEKPSSIPQEAWDQIKNAAKIFGVGASAIGSWWNALSLSEKKMYWQTAKAVLNLKMVIPELEGTTAESTTGKDGSTLTKEELLTLLKDKKEEDEKDNTLLYVGLGVGALLIVGLIAVVAMKK